MSLAAARRLGVPGVAMCCMNWADVYSHYYKDRPEAAGGIETMTEGYSGADVFLQPRPHMPMAQLPNGRSIGPICREGRNLRSRLQRVLGLDEDTRIILLTLGGFSSPDAMDLPIIERGHWLIRGPHPAGRDDVIAIETLGFSVLDLTFSADLVVCKDSYCSIVEAARAGTRMAIVPRPDWPETDCLVEWAKRRCNAELAPGGLADGRALKDCLLSTLGRPPLPPVRAGGVEEAITAIEAVCGMQAASRRPSFHFAAANASSSDPSADLPRARRAG
jgi:hypothetical protein